MQTKRMKGNRSGFIASAKQLAFCKLMDLPTTSAFRAPPNVSEKNLTPKGQNGFDTSKFGG